MNVRGLAEGVICVGFDGYECERSLQEQLRGAHLAGLILFARNVRSVEQTRALTDTIRSCFRERAPLIAIDQEGGRVARIRAGTTEIPSMMAVAATGDADLARAAGAQTAHDLRRIGVNLDFAPVLDLAIHGANTVIGTRAFGDDPHTVARFASAFAAGLERGGVVATYKHFPGHGSTAVDSHLSLPVVDLDEATLRGRDLAPFAALLPGARAVMTAHIVLNAFAPERPATTARRILTGLLRDELHFGGVCFTDCLQMDAIAKTVGTPAGAVLALEAGADCVLISHSFALAMETAGEIERAVRENRLPLARLQEAFERVQTLRGLVQPPIAADAPAPHPNVGREIGRRAVTLMRGEARVAADCVVISFEGTTTEGVQGTHALHPSLREHNRRLSEHRLPLDPAPNDVQALADALAQETRDVVIVARRAHVYTGQARAIERILALCPGATFVSAREPFDVELFPQARNVLATYGDDAPSIAGLAEVLFAGVPAQGTFPVRWAAVR